ncbi:Sin3a C-terminal domain-containing protein [Elsinoe fawcettii]|nr:Sin3a C-terminal domain-containing protein [Elsinoe fawcettii]
MNPSHRDWPRPPASANNIHREGEQPHPQSHRPGAGYGPSPSQASPHAPASSLPQSSGKYQRVPIRTLENTSPDCARSGHFVPYQQPAHGLPALASIGQGSPRNQPLPPAAHHQGAFPSGSREAQEARDREARDVHIKEEQDRRERDIRERQLIEQMHPQQAQGPPIQLHQPVAVGPHTVHGPNGLLGNPAALAGAGAPQQMSGPPGAPPAYSGPLMQQAPGQAVQPGLSVPSPAAAAQAAAQAQGQQPILNDALSYLDQVKIQFHENPDVYNRFLDIMKDFKSGVIDTPGVIDRVSSLFAGNPPLIQGFNTFLPPGYRIECGTGDDPNAIRVTTPMGNTVLAMPTPYRALSRGPDGAERGNGARTPQPGYSPSGRPVGPATVSAQIAAQQAHAEARDGAHTLQDSARGMFQQHPGTSPIPGRVTPLPPGEGGPDGQAGDLDDKKEPVEFNHAINYVNKIKNRFSSQPEIYKSFLDILQTYQRESRPIQEVYGQVTKLFESASDLLEDFKQFLPESTAKSKSKSRRAEGAVKTSDLRESSKTAQLQKTPHADNRLPPVGNFAPTPTVNKDHKRKRGDTKSGMASLGITPNENGKGLGASGSVVKKAKHSGGMRLDEAAAVSPTLVPSLPEPMPPTSKTSATSDELGFFDRVKKTIGNKNTMNEFLKLCNLFTQDLIDKTTLVHRARSFIGSNPELFKWFTTWVGYEDSDALVIENRARHPSGRVMLSNCRGLGPSYRLLPKRERLKPCSGRDELCNSVLNDDWASHPTWASEDSGFIAHRKNTYEEGLHKIEEERHDYDFHIEACGRTIQLLEPFAQQLLRMPEKERESVEIPPGIGGQSETVHKRIIMKIYGRQAGQDVIEALHQKPYAVIPIVLNRLKQKHEEWKNAQREWEKVWRDQTSKIFWKSLDHQAVNAKQADKRQFQTKTLLGEIQTKYEEQKKQRVQGASLAQVTKPQMTFTIEDMDVVADACCLVLTYAEHQHSTEAPRFASFIGEFVPMFFSIEPEWFNHQIKLKLGEESGDEIMSDYDGSAGPRRKTGKKDDLRRGVLDRVNKNGRNDGSGTPLSRASTPDHASRADEEMSEAAEVSAEDGVDSMNDTWANYPAGLNKYRNKEINLNEPYKRNDYNLYGNTSIYCFIRMFVILYERLSKLKESEADVQDAVRRAMMSKAAIDLGLVEKQPTDFFGDVSPSANYYRQMLGMFDDLIRNNDIDQPHIEETLRRYYLQSGWQLYSVDKLLSALVRFVIGIMASDSRDKSWEILQAFKKDRVKDETTYYDEMNYRKTVERYIKDGDTYKINFVRPTPIIETRESATDYVQDAEKSVISMKVFKRDEPTFETSTMIAEDVWRVYVNDFLSTSPTHGTPMELVSLPILKRNIKAAASVDTTGEDEEGQALARRYDFVKAKEQLEFKIAVGDLKLGFTPENDEYWHQMLQARTGGKKGIEAAEETVHHRDETVAEKFKMNNEGMKGLSKEDVEGKNEQFRKVTEGIAQEGREEESEKMDVS